MLPKRFESVNKLLALSNKDLYYEKAPYRYPARFFEY